MHDRALTGCWFELLRQGGCGDAEVLLQREFHERSAIEIGDWISIETDPEERCYLGRVEECRYQLPGLLRIRLTGMAIELNEIFPGGFQAGSSESRPHRYGATDLFSNDPDRSWEVAYPTLSIEDLVHWLIRNHVEHRTHIQYVPSLIEAPIRLRGVQSLKFRGEESLRSILKDLALRVQASWGVDPQGRFFFLQKRTAIQNTLQIAENLIACEEIRDRDMIFNRLLLTGDYVYDKRDLSGQIARRVFRWRANYFEPDSCSQYGNRRLRLWIPWIRTQADSLDFAREFFRTYAYPVARYSVETRPGGPMTVPWEGPLQLNNPAGEVLCVSETDKVRVFCDQAIRMRLQLGPEDPREQWPEPPHDERWEIPDHIPSYGGKVSVTEYPSDGGGGGGGHSTAATSSHFTDHSTVDSSSYDGSSDTPSDSLSGSSLSSNLGEDSASWDATDNSDQTNHHNHHSSNDSAESDSQTLGQTSLSEEDSSPGTSQELTSEDSLLSSELGTALTHSSNSHYTSASLGTESSLVGTSTHAATSQTSSAGDETTVSSNSFETDSSDATDSSDSHANSSNSNSNDSLSVSLSGSGSPSGSSYDQTNSHLFSSHEPESSWNSLNSNSDSTSWSLNSSSNS